MVSALLHSRKSALPIPPERITKSATEKASKILELHIKRLFLSFFSVELLSWSGFLGDPRFSVKSRIDFWAQPNYE